MSPQGILKSLLILAIATTSFAMSTAKYNNPIANRVPVVETRDELHNMVRAYPETTLDEVDGGLHMRGADGAVYAVVGDKLVPEMQAASDTADAVRAKRELEGFEGEEDNITRRDENGALKCNHTHCQTSFKCLAHNDCHVCIRNKCV